MLFGRDMQLGTLSRNKLTTPYHQQRPLPNGIACKCFSFEDLTSFSQGPTPPRSQVEAKAIWRCFNSSSSLTTIHKRKVICEIIHLFVIYNTNILLCALLFIHKHTGLVYYSQCTAWPGTWAPTIVAFGRVCSVTQKRQLIDRLLIVSLVSSRCSVTDVTNKLDLLMKEFVEKHVINQHNRIS